LGSNNPFVLARQRETAARSRQKEALLERREEWLNSQLEVSAAR
jgi:hypothetical protein